MKPASPRWRVFSDSERLAAAAADAVLEAARAAIAARGAFHIVLAGGHTPQAVYARLATGNTAWRSWQVYFGDERCLPRGDVGRNDARVWQAWLKRVPIPAGNIHGIPAEHGPETGARLYAATLANVPEFDLVLLGLGEDGHTASLFPGRPLDGSVEVLAVTHAPKPPPERVSMSAARLSRSRKVLFLVSGAGKCAAVTAWRHGRNIPAGMINPPGGVDVWLDEEAAADA